MLSNSLTLLIPLIQRDEGCADPYYVTEKQAFVAYSKAIAAASTLWGMSSHSRWDIPQTVITMTRIRLSMQNWQHYISLTVLLLLSPVFISAQILIFCSDIDTLHVLEQKQQSIIASLLIMIFSITTFSDSLVTKI